MLFTPENPQNEEQHEYIRSLEAAHDKGEADYAVFLWARRLKEQDIIIKGTDTDLVFYALALTDSGLLPGKNVLIDKSHSSGPCFVKLANIRNRLQEMHVFRDRKAVLGAELLFMYLLAGGDYTASWRGKGYAMNWGKSLFDEVIYSNCCSARTSGYHEEFPGVNHLRGIDASATESLVSLHETAPGLPSDKYPSINVEPAMLFIATQFYNKATMLQLCNLSMKEVIEEAGYPHDRRSDVFKQQLEDTLYSWDPSEIPNVQDADPTNQVANFLELHQRAMHCSEGGDEEKTMPNTAALRLQLFRCIYVMLLVYESVTERASIVRDNYAKYGWSKQDAEGGPVPYIWDDSVSPPVDSNFTQSESGNSESVAGTSAGSATSKKVGCGCKPDKNGNCCATNRCSCRKPATNGGAPKACSAACHCQKSTTNNSSCMNPLTMMNTVAQAILSTVPPMPASTSRQQEEVATLTTGSGHEAHDDSNSETSESSDGCDIVEGGGSESGDSVVEADD